MSFCRFAFVVLLLVTVLVSSLVTAEHNSSHNVMHFQHWYNATVKAELDQLLWNQDLKNGTKREKRRCEARQLSERQIAKMTGLTTLLRSEPLIRCVLVRYRDQQSPLVSSSQRCRASSFKKIIILADQAGKLVCKSLRSAINCEMTKRKSRSNF